MYQIPTPFRASLGIGLIVAVGWFAATSPSIAPAQDTMVKAEGARTILRDPGTPLAGAPHADVTVVEYFDYNCPYCKKLTPEFQALMRADRAVGILYKEWPILGPVSVYAARAALAAGWQGRYLDAHDALIAAPRLISNAQVDVVLLRAGIDMESVARSLTEHSDAIDALLVRNENEAKALGLRGTPGILIGRRLLDGYADSRALAALSARARKEP